MIDSRAGAGKEQDEPSGVRKQGHAQKQKDGSMSKGYRGQPESIPKGRSLSNKIMTVNK